MDQQRVARFVQGVVNAVEAAQRPAPTPAPRRLT
jgi:hypothetical protein